MAAAFVAAAFVAAAATSTAAFARTLLLQLCADRGPRGRALLFASCVLVARMTYAACGSAACLLTDGSGTACVSIVAEVQNAFVTRKRSALRLGQISEVRTQINLFFRRKNSGKTLKQVSSPIFLRLRRARSFSNIGFNCFTYSEHQSTRGESPTRLREYRACV